MERMGTRMLIVFFKAGAGHLNTAQALREEMARRFPGEYEFLLLDGAPPQRRLFSLLTAKGYDFLSMRFPRIQGIVYFITGLPVIRRAAARVIREATRAHIQGGIKAFRPRMVVITHPFAIPAVTELMEGGADFQCLLTVLDVESAPDWFQNPRIPALVGTRALHTRALGRFHYPPSRLFLVPPILGPGYDGPPSPKTVRDLKGKHGFDPGRRLVLIAGGGNGMPRCRRIVMRLIKAGLREDLAIVCGRNAALREDILRALRRRGAGTGARVAVYGWVDFMPELMAMADVVVSKAGYSGVFQALVLGKPLIIASRIFGQEDGNARFVQSRGLGHVLRGVRGVGKAVRRALDDRGGCAALARKLESEGIRNGAGEAAALIHRMLGRRL